MIVPPGELLNLAASAQVLANAGLEVVVAPSATATTVVDRLAVAGWFADIAQFADEPSALGRQVGRGIWGEVSVNPAGAAIASA